MKRTVAVVVAASLALAAGGWMSAEVQPDEMQMPDMSQMMEMMKKAAEPDEHHKMLEKMAGDWKMTAKFMMSPGAPPEVSHGTCKSTLILGGRQLMSEVSLDMVFMGQKQDFSGFGLMGYDKTSGEFQSCWADTMGTGQMIQTGGMEDGNIVVAGQAKNIMGEYTVKNIIKFVEGGYNMEFWEAGEMTGGQLMNTGVIEYRKN